MDVFDFYSNEDIYLRTCKRKRCEFMKGRINRDELVYDYEEVVKHKA